MWSGADGDVVVNVLKGKGKGWTEESAFDADKDKTQFRQYEAACDRVKNFYQEQHGAPPVLLQLFSSLLLHCIAESGAQRSRRWSSTSRCV